MHPGCWISMATTRELNGVSSDSGDAMGPALAVLPAAKREKKDMKNFNIDLFFPIFDPNSIFNKEKEEIEPTTDEILDKISQNGIESLTEKEKQILDNYGKRKNGGR
jgi:hypothetical protein